MKNIILDIQSDSSTFHSSKWLQTTQAVVTLAQQSDSLVLHARKSDGTVVIIGGHGGGSTGGDSLQKLGKIQPLQSTTIEPEQCAVYTYTLVGGQVFNFVHSSQQRVTNFRLWLTMPNPIVSFTFPSDVRWIDQYTPSFNIPSALYCLVFQWCPVINKWRANMEQGAISL